MAVFLTVVGTDVSAKQHALLQLVQNPDERSASFSVDTASFAAIPGSPFAYWASQSALRIYRELQSLSEAGVDAMSTNQLSDDARYARLWWEVTEASAETWVPWAKGRTYSPFHYDIHTVVRWDFSRGTYTGFVGTSARPLEKPASADWFFRPGLTWPRRSNTLSFSVLPRGSIFGNKGPAIFVPGDDEQRLLALCGVLNSVAFKYLLSLQVARVELAQSFEVGLVQKVPVPPLHRKVEARIAEIVGILLLAESESDCSSEISHSFVAPRPLLGETPSTDGLSHWNNSHDLNRELEDIVFSAYGFTLEERTEIVRWAEQASVNAGPSGGDTDVEASVDDDAVLSWAVGVAFGRFDRRLAAGERVKPPSRDPFEPLPPSSYAMQSVADREKSIRPGILVDDPGHAADLPQRITDLLQELGLGSKPEYAQDSIRSWLARTYWRAHIKMYSASRRRAPIWWQLCTPSLRYSVWISWRELTSDTLYRLLNEFVSPKLAHERAALDLLRKENLGHQANELHRTETQAGFVGELEAMSTEIRRVAPLWAPHPDDGVLINFAPLWRLVPQNTDWQKELRETWEALRSGDLDWSHLAMRLWPERVVPKCVDDRSLAIAHGIENAFWFEDDRGKWQPLNTPLRSVEHLVAERTSPAVKDALKNLLEAPNLMLPSTRIRKSKAA